MTLPNRNPNPGPDRNPHSHAGREPDPQEGGGGRHAARATRAARSTAPGLADVALLPLRLFLGVTFCYAGLDKLTDPAFPGLMEGLLNSVQGAAAPWLLDLALTDPDTFGYAIAFGELAVGLGTLAGLFTRVAAVGGALISLSFWLTISWNIDTYYYSQDLPYLMAWIPLIIAGARLYSLDALLAAYRARRREATAGAADTA
ncbi:DoxX family protein [Streptomyces alkaliterrae]|uniref:DoxX family membrane protein n=1 Tax=Streptomyces alkaliterrae TaxID=2213162 RepID=A0A5P0YUE1_9ACTN|nr:DoxX family protein [Streptomyces alkaliterrae]MBB1252852.1 DoxX family protein [Streptomyces alkaliterrae]MBB1258817.1 DoxX family protein [Streptomyces alkaliterrae]MQS03062.1 DoxX family membrane protein [Streptomyces alkaliterrae]